MPLARGLATSSVLHALLLVLVLLSPSTPAACHVAAHNVTAILSGRQGLAEFSRALTATGLVDGANGLDAVTVLAVDDARMVETRGLPREALRRAFSRHVLVGYYDDAGLRRLHSGAGGSADVVVAPTLLDAPAGAVKIVARQRRVVGRVVFVPLDDARAGVLYVRPMHDAPRNVSVLLVSGVMWSPAATPPKSSLLKPSPAPPEQDPFRAGESRLVSPDAVTSTAQFQAPSDVTPSRNTTTPKQDARDGARANVLPAQESVVSSPVAKAASPPEPRPNPSAAAPLPAPPEHAPSDKGLGTVFVILLVCYLAVCLCR